MRVLPLGILLAGMVLGGAFSCRADGLGTGQRLFERPGLAGSAKRCADCHPNGKGLQETAAYDDGQLREMINFCIRDALKGRMLPADAPALTALLTYLRSLAPPR